MKKIVFQFSFSTLFIFLLSLFLTSPVLAFSGYGNGTSDYPYQITTCSQLEEMANNLSAYYQQDNDIDCSGITITPIGSSTNPFTGTFDGKNFAISNFTINMSANYSGLFGYTTGASIENVRVVSGSVTDAGWYVGSLIGDASTGTTVTHSSSQIDVSGTAYSGGLVGVSNGSLAIEKSFYNGNLNGGLNTGGLVGAMQGNSSVISDSYAVGTAGSNNVGGLIGFTSIGGTSQISNSYANFTLSGSLLQNVGGLVGVDETGTVTDSFSVSVISATGTDVAAVIGNGGATATGVYFDEYLATTNSCAGAGATTCTAVNSGNATPNYFKGNNTNAPMSSWDFVNTWQTNSGGYPTLKGFSSPAPINPVRYTQTTDPNYNPGPSTPKPQECSNSAPTGLPNLFQVSASDNTVTVYFAPVSGQDSGYTISYGINNNADSYTTSFNYTDKGGAVPYTINYLFPGTWYFKVRGQNGCMPGEWSGVMSVKVSSQGSVVSSKVLGLETSRSGLVTKCTNYTVQAGDTLWGIASLKLGNGTKFGTLMQQNGLNSSLIRAGQTLKIGC